jgi:hypothetical protein
VRQWDENRFLKAVKRESTRRLAERPITESLGLNYKYKLTLQRRTFTENGTKRGEQTAHLLGKTSVITTAEDARDLAKRATLDGDIKCSNAIDTIHHDQKKHAQLRARLTLNRSSLNAVRNARNKKATSADLGCPHCGPQVPETIQHTLFNCPKYRNRRQELMTKLHEYVQKIKEKSRHTMWRALKLDDTIYMHITLCTPYIMTCLHSNMSQKEIFELLHLTGAFFEYINSIRPI